MQFKILYAPEALEEIRRAVLYYESESPGLGKRFKAHLQAEINTIKASPFSRSYRYQQGAVCCGEKVSLRCSLHSG